MEKIPVPMNAVRVCNAISRIGYEPHSALMDIIDNSVAADALHIRLIIDLVDGKTINQRNNVMRYRIIDDGKGMDESGIQNALRLGSDDSYKANSLSKYGMGLKSAGFSLGSRIQIISKQNGQLSHKYILDRNVIKQENDYLVLRDQISETETVEYTKLLGDGPSGTIVEIMGCGEIYHTSAKTTIDKLKHRLGVTYFPFLSESDETKRLQITLSFPGEEAYIIKPLDILFSEDAMDSFDPSTYTGAYPCYAFRDDWNIGPTNETNVAPIKLEVITFPKDGMGGPASPLSDHDKARIKSYKISRENKGFFIYRNGRLIRWGDDLEIVGKDLIGFRARMELSTEHDDLLHVDVSKQRLEMDDETHNDLGILMRLPRKQAEQIFDICQNILKKSDGEGIVFSKTADLVPEEDPVEEIVPPDPEQKKKRAKKREDESKKILAQTTLEETGEPSNESEAISEDEFRRIRYSDNLNTMNLWSTQKDPIQGTYVLINRRHAFYQSTLSSFDEASPERLALEAVIFCCAIGENKTYENLTDIKDDHIAKVFERYHAVFSYTLNAWAASNQNIFEK